MASSVSSEHAFSSAGITISKRWNRLKGDIVEALQCLKSLINHNVMTRDVMNLSKDEAHLDRETEQQDVEIDVVEGDSDLLTDSESDEVCEDENSADGEDSDCDDTDSEF